MSGNDGCEPSEIQDRIAATYHRVLDQTQGHAEEVVWDTIRSVEELGRVRMAAMQLFMEDYEKGRAERRYIQAELPT